MKTETPDLELIPPETWGDPEPEWDRMIQAREHPLDEFFTLPEDVASEIGRYPRSVFEGRRIFCPCDGPDSAFLRVLRSRQDTLRIESVEGSSDEFRRFSAIETLDRSDIVITNPPFSLLRQFLRWVWDADKAFLIVAPMTAMGNVDIIEEIRADRMIARDRSGELELFRVPEEYAESRIPTKVKNGVRYARVRCCWLTNLPDVEPPAPFDLKASFETDSYPVYDNFEAIEVDSLARIPKDYYGVMAVPATYIPRHDPRLFEILGHLPSSHRMLDGKKKWLRVLIRRVKN